MKNLDLLELLEKSEAYADGVTVLAEGSIDSAVATFATSNPRWAGYTFARLPRKHQCGVLDLAQLVEA
jgi:hypothetical protein